METIKKIRFRVNWIIAVAILVSFFCQGFAYSAAKVNKDVILVLDTSLSMVGYQGRNIFEDVKVSVYKYIDSLQDGDRVTFVTFDEDLKIFPTVVLDDKNDRDIVKKYISVTEAKGQWTFTLKMLKAVFALADTITKQNQKENPVNPRNVVIVIMSDGLDDPPPANSKETFNLKKIAEQYSGNDWWIYIVNLAEMQKSKEISAAQQALKEELSKVSENTAIIGGENPDKAINEDLKKDVEEKEWQQVVKLLPYLAAIFLIVLIIVILLLRRSAGTKISGVLEYWNHELLKPEVHSVNLAGYNMKLIAIGRHPDSVLRIRDFEARGMFYLKAVREKGVIRIKISHDEGLEIFFKNKESDGYVNNGDIFAVSNYSFRYNA
ncbi:MAG TPA: vWA domain-containing protein [Spirochaetota bacterium]|nr:VWA domain-containing protein [Spirochaetota bacterium]OQA95476.1 MAG: von Willebrand factor type A domain protein [Spirochaetes bacterium ADurb.Bin218]HON17145.1 vWA domain-containing protein [Spirochaetota bacterium]HOQ13077.1 vWA domain-containing protein [Spirochaetota bacterium]HOV07822.1 vWA domain-containing protein [Spirochaetota bacterium]